MNARDILLKIAALALASLSVWILPVYAKNQPGPPPGSTSPVSAPAMSAPPQMSPIPAAHTQTIANVAIPDDVKVGRQQLMLNGAGVYKRWWFIKEYVAALYLDDTATSTAQAVVVPGPKRIALYMLRSISDQQFASDLTDEIIANSSSSDVSGLDSKITHFQHLLSSVNKGGEVDFDYIPGQGVRVSIDGKARGTIKGAGFERALLRVWLGDDPVDRGLKKKLLAASSAPDL